MSESGMRVPVRVYYRAVTRVQNTQPYNNHKNRARRPQKYRQNPN